MMKPKIVLITHFEPTDGREGELSRFVSGLGLEPLRGKRVSALGGLFVNPDRTILAMVSGVGAVQSAAKVVAVGMAGNTDLSESLWLISGIAGGDPDTCSLGSPVWADWCVDGDLAWEVDSREIPDDWSTGILPLGSSAPFQEPAGAQGVFGQRYEKFELPEEVCRWAFEVSSRVELEESEECVVEGKRYEESPKASEGPSVRVGATLSAVRFWHGERMNAWAQEWVTLFTKGRGIFHTSSMEDSGTLYGIRDLSQMGLADANRVLLLRAVSNFTRPPRGHSAISTLLSGDGDEAYFPGYQLALENGYRAALAIIKEWLQKEPSL
ncbi:MAG: purine nucleoside permease [Verrucomicrobiota bacterium]